MPDRFTVKLTPSFLKDLESLHRKEQERVLSALKRLESEPFGPPPHVKKLKGRGLGQWRLRVGVYRVRSDVVRRDVVLYRVRHRKDTYEARACRPRGPKGDFRCPEVLKGKTLLVGFNAETPKLI